MLEEAAPAANAIPGADAVERKEIRVERDRPAGADCRVAISAAIAARHSAVAPGDGFAHGLERPRPQQFAIDDREAPPAT